jgi:pimeloyl-ACP methyl ester carboxylesterase
VDVTQRPHRVDPITLPAGGRDVSVTSTDGTRIHTTVFGPEDAPTVVLSHGFSQQQVTWAYQLRDLMADHRVIVYDQRGHGRSGWAEHYTIDALGEDLHAVLEATLPAGDKAVLAGHSMGGISIMSWAKQYPDQLRQRAAAVVFVNTAASEIGLHVGVVGVPQRMHPMAKYVVRKRLLTLVRTRSRLPLRMLAFGVDPHPTHVDAVLKLISVATSRTLRSFIVALIDMDVTDALPLITCPTVIVAGARDRLLPPVHNRRIGPRLPNLERMIMIPAVGHMGPWESREIVSGALREAASTHLFP